MINRSLLSAIARFTGLATLALLVLPAPAHAQYESFTLAPGFSPDPVVGTGESGGSRQTSCGYVDMAYAPDHVLTLEDAFEYLRVSVAAAGDVSLLIEGPGGQICSDDVNGVLPEVEGYWPEGVYRLWIGDDNRTSYDYTLRISQEESDRTSENDGATDAASLSLQPGFTPANRVLRGESGGDRLSDCGYVRRLGAPNHTVELTDAFDYLRVSVDAPGDVTMLIEGPGGQICSDDVNGVLPEVAGYWPEGIYQVWIGDFNQAGYDYELTFSESNSDSSDGSSDSPRRNFGNLPSIGDFTVIRNTYYDAAPIREFDAEVDGQRQRWWANCNTNALGTGERTAPPSSHARTIADFVCDD